MEEFTQISALLLPVIYWTRTGAFGNAVKAFQGSLEMTINGSAPAPNKAYPYNPLNPFSDFWNSLKGGLGLFGQVKNQYQNNPVGKIPVP